MRGLTSLIVSVLSFVTLVVSGPLQSSTRSSRSAENHVSARQFHYPRALLDVCADVDLSSVLGLDLGRLLGHVCLCLSAFPLDTDLDATLQLLVNNVGEANLKALVRHDPPQPRLPHSHGLLSRLRTMAPSVLIPITLPPNAPLETSAIFRAWTALSNREAHVSAADPTPSATESVALTRTLVLPCSMAVFKRLMFH